MNRSNILLVATALALATTLAYAAAGDDPRPHRQQRAEARFAETDANHDGRISQSEWQSARLRDANDKFRKLDGNRDGNLSREELVAAHAARKGHRRGAMAEKLRSMDADGDQQLSRAELGTRMPRLAQDFERLDGNRDGKLSREEIRAGRAQRKAEATR